MDDIFDAMLYDESSTIGKEARSLLKIQQPLHQRVPKQIDGYFTRDIALAVPWRTKQVSQGGFTIVRPNRTVFEHYLQVVHAANYSARCDNRGGWGKDPVTFLFIQKRNKKAQYINSHEYFPH